MNSYQILLLNFIHRQLPPIALMILLFSILQTITHAGPPSPTTQGGRPAGSYNLGGFDNVNLFNGNLNVKIPLLKVGGRGEAGFTIPFVIESKWMESVGFVGQSPVYKYDPYLVANVNALPGTLADATTTYNWYETNPISCGQTDYQPSIAIVAFNFTSNDGTSQTFRPVVNNGNPIQVPYCNPGVFTTNLGKEFITWDGSGTKLIADYDVYHNGQGYRMRSSDGSNTPIGWTVLFPNGTRYRFDLNGLRWIEDRNGNRINFYYNADKVSQITDSLGRHIYIDYIDDEPIYGQHIKIRYKGFGGIERIIRASNSKIWLPDGRTYNFAYNSNYELTRIELPTGGAYEYNWDGTIPPATQPGQTPNSVPFRYVTERRVYSDGVNLTSKMTFSAPTGTTQVNVYDSTNSLLSRTKHYFHGSPVPQVPLANQAWQNGAAEVEDDLLKGKEYKTEIYADNGVSLLRRNEAEWQSGRTVVWNYATNTFSISINQRIASNKVTLADVNPNLVSKTEYLYNQGTWANAFFNVPTDTFEYDWGSSAPGSFLRRSHTEYNSYENYASGAYITLLPTENWISSDIAGSNKLALTKTEYDNYAPDSLVDRPGIVGHNPSWKTNVTARGNASKVTGYADANALTGAVSVASQYDVAGNVVKTIDARNYATTLDYSDNFGSPDTEARTNSQATGLTGQTYAFVKSATNPLGFKNYTQYDYFTGTIVNNEDINGNINASYYNDLLDRPTQTINAVNRAALKSQTTVAYDDSLRKVTVTSDLKTYNDNLLKSESFYDKLGRTTEARSYEGAIYVATATQYDALGRAYKVSNPYRSGETVRWTTTKFDSLGRVIEVKTPDDAKVSRAYDGNRVLVTDQAGKQRLGKTNAAGQMSDVWEIRAADANTVAVTFPNRPEVTAGYQTSYTFDVLGNIRQTAQGGQIRYFSYDSLSRLIRAKQPEQNSNPNLALATPDAVTNNNSWSVSYSYDANGNIQTTTDARNITVTGTYDALNRLTFRDYSDSTPDASFDYDNLPNAKGLLTVVTTGSVSSPLSVTRNISFDELGRIKSSQQTTSGQTYSFSDYTYDLAGNLISQTYPSGRVVTNSIDDDGKLSSVKGQMPGQSEKTYASDFRYTAAGMVDRVKLGNTRWESIEYDPNRLQVTKIGLGSTSGDMSLLKLEFDYGTAQENNGSLRKQIITVPGGIRDAGFTATQEYTYDALNRLDSTKETLSGSIRESWQQSFAYDRFGNRRIDASRTTASFVGLNPDISEATNRIMPRAGEQYRYDAAGNLDRDHAGNTFIFDAENRQTKYNGGAAAGGADYFYDGAGKRVRKIAGVVETIFVYDAFGKLAAEYETNAAAQPAATKYLTGDQLGSPRVVTDNNGTIVARHDYLAFGEELLAGTSGRTTAQGYNQPDNVRQQFTGYERDAESGLDYAQARYYNSKHGRFTSVDPLTASASIRNPQTFNRYSYALNSPYKFTDPLGLAPCGNSNPNGGNAGRECTQADDLTQDQFNRGLVGYIFDRVSQGYLDDSGSMTTSMFSAFIETSTETNQDGIRAEFDQNSGLCRKTDYACGPFVVSEEKLIEIYGTPDKPKSCGFIGDGQCPKLPQALFNNDDLGLTRHWRDSGIKVAGNHDLKRGTIIGTFDPDGTFGQKDSGQHAAIYWGQDKRGKYEGIIVIDQYNNRRTGRSHVGFRWIRVDGDGRVNDARAFTVVYSIAPAKRPK